MNGKGLLSRPPQAPPHLATSSAESLPAHGVRTPSPKSRAFVRQHELSLLGGFVASAFPAPSLKSAGELLQEPLLGGGGGGGGGGPVPQGVVTANGGSIKTYTNDSNGSFSNLCVGGGQPRRLSQPFSSSPSPGLTPRSSMLGERAKERRLSLTYAKGARPSSPPLVPLRSLLCVVPTPLLPPAASAHHGGGSSAGSDALLCALPQPALSSVSSSPPFAGSYARGSDAATSAAAAAQPTSPRSPRHNSGSPRLSSGLNRYGSGGNISSSSRGLGPRSSSGLRLGGQTIAREPSPRVLLLSNDSSLANAVKAAVEREAPEAPDSSDEDDGDGGGGGGDAAAAAGGSGSRRTSGAGPPSSPSSSTQDEYEHFKRTLLDDLRADGAILEANPASLRGGDVSGAIDAVSTAMSGGGTAVAGADSPRLPVSESVLAAKAGDGIGGAGAAGAAAAAAAGGCSGAAAGTPRDARDGAAPHGEGAAKLHRAPPKLITSYSQHSLDSGCVLSAATATPRGQAPMGEDSVSSKPVSPRREKRRGDDEWKEVHVFLESISPIKMADALESKLGVRCACCHDNSTGATYAEVGGVATTEEAGRPLQMTEETLTLISRARNIFHCELAPAMTRERTKELIMQLQEALRLFTATSMPFSHRIDVLIKAVSSARWSQMTDVEAVMRELREAYKNQEPRIEPLTQRGARTIELFWKGDTNATGHLTQVQTKSLLRMLNMNIARHVFEARFKQFDYNENGVLEFNDFQGFYDKLCERAECEPIFTKLAPTDERYMTVMDTLEFNELHEFLRTVQGDDVKIATTREIVREYDCLEFQGFCRYLTSPNNGWWNNTRDTVYQDMTHPLHCYTVFSSHNTYLSGDQITSESSVLMYKYALLRGCRCVEIDVWDGRDGLPMVTHGNTRTSNIPFKDVIEAIDGFAFVKSKYPVVLSLEVHASMQQQVAMAEIMRQVFGSKMLDPLSNPRAYEPEFNTPEALKEKILLKGRDSALHFEADDMGRSQSVTSPATTTTPADGPNFDSPVMMSPTKSMHGRRVAKELADILYLRSVKLSSDVHTTLQNVRPDNISSLPEWKAERMMGAELAALSKGLLIRVYPKGTRVDSSNFEPQLFWASGCQYVALNLQTPDYPVRLNQAKFEDNGGCGWLLKPDWLQGCRSQAVTHHEVKEIEVIEVLVLSAGNLPNSRKNIDPYVEGFVCKMPCVCFSLFAQPLFAVDR